MKPGKWFQLQDGDSDTWLEVRHLGKRAFQFVEVIDMHSATGDTHGDRYAAEVDLVDLDKLSAKQVVDVKRSCGWEGAGDLGDAGLAEMCWQYGCKAPVWSGSGTSRVRLHREARSAAHQLLDDDALEEAMDRPVNALGSTAAEYMAGDIYSAMQRGCEAGDPTARLTAKLYQIPQETIDDVRPGDWLPYLVGYMAGRDGQADEHHKDLAVEYTRGYERGCRVRLGEAPAPGWIMQQQQVARSEPHVVSEGVTAEGVTYWAARNKLKPGGTDSGEEQPDQTGSQQPSDPGDDREPGGPTER